MIMNKIKSFVVILTIWSVLPLFADSYSSITDVNGIRYTFYLGGVAKVGSVIDYTSGQRYSCVPWDTEGEINIPPFLVVGSSIYRVEGVLPRGFWGCSKITKVTLPFTVTSIGANAFSDCSSLKTVSVMGEIKEIGSNTFRNCSNLENVNIPKGVTDIGSYAFISCSMLKTISLPSTITTIGDYAFYGCAALENIEIPNGVNSIGVNAFSGCTKIEKVKIGSNNFVLSNAMFSSCPNYSLEIDEGVVGIGENTNGITLGNSVPAQISSLIIPNSVAEISSSFSGCTNLRSVSVSWREPNDVIITQDCFNDIPNNSQLLVPLGTKSKYENHAIWNRFSTIVERSGIACGDIKMSLGNTTSLPILLKEESIIRGLQFRLKLPEGVSVVENEGNPVVSLTDRTEGFTVMGRKDPDADNSYLFVLFSLEGNPITGNNGSVMNVRISVDPNVEMGKYETIMEDVSMTTATFETQKPVSAVSELIINDLTLGDINNEGSITAQDASLALQLVAKKINSGTEGIVYEAADVNGDGQVTAQDASLILQYVAKKISW